MLFEDIEKEFLLLKYRLEYTDKKYYHLNSIENFILNFDQINSGSKEFVIDSLGSCIEYYKENSIIDIYHSRNVFNKHLKPVGEIYEKEAGFTPLIKPWILTIFVLLIHFIIYISGINLMITIIFDLLILGFIFHLAIKYRNHKLYAFLW